MKKYSPNDSIVYGIKSVEELLRDPEKVKSIEKILVDKRKQKSFNALFNLIREKKVSVHYVPDITIEKLARGKNHQGILAYVIPISYYSIYTLIEQEGLSKINLILFLDRITDVRNFGAIARSAYAMGVNAILIPHKDTASINADAVKTSAGALLKIPICKEHDIVEVLKYLSNKGFQIIACHEKTSRLIHEVDFTRPSVIILGSEHNGILSQYLTLCHAEAKIPMLQKFDSLNVSVSAGIVLYEVIKQRMR